MKSSAGYHQVINWLKQDGRKPFLYQEEAWQAYFKGYSGLVNAPTGFGKTFSLFLAVIIKAKADRIPTKGLKLIWITPLRSLAKDLARAMREVLADLEMDWHVGVRNGDTPSAERLKQKTQMPEVLLTTPESIHLLLAQKNHKRYFKNLQCVVVDEWHELLGSKRGVLVELALSRIKSIVKQSTGADLKVWGISATIGNLNQALDVLIPQTTQKRVIIKAKLKKKIKIESLLPDRIEKLPWAGHMGLNMAEKLIPVIYKSRTILIFINTRGQAERWYQHLLEIEPNLAGQIAIHHGSIDFELRNWIEEALHQGSLKVVLATSSLDLGVDFKPVDTVVQVGSPKGVARFLQRAGRSGHSPHEWSKIYFLPTHALELVEIAAIKEAVVHEQIESREPYVMVFDTLVQYLITLAIGEGFNSAEIFTEIKLTHAFSDINPAEWSWVMHFITTGGESLTAYPEFKKVALDPEDGLWKVKNRMMAMRHRLQIGTIVSDVMLKVKFLSGGYIGMVEESFISRMKVGDVFILGGRVLEYVRLKELTVMVRISTSTKAIAPSWLGGRLPLSSNLGKLLRQQYNNVLSPSKLSPELQAVLPLFRLQAERSHVPRNNELLIELIHNKEGYHLFVYPFEGRLVHEVMAALVAYRLSKLMPLSFSLAMNDYGFELLSDQEIPMDDAIAYEVFSPENLIQDIQLSINATEMAKRKFRDIACIAGLVFQGYPGKYVANRQIQSSTALFFDVFNEYDTTNLLLKQAYEEVFYQQIEEPRLFAALQRIQQSLIVITNPKRFTPLAFPIKVDSLRESMSSESLTDRVARMTKEAIKSD